MPIIVFGMNTEILLRLCDRYAQAGKLSEATIATYAAGAGGFFQRIRKGHDVTTRRAVRVAQWFSDHWPLDLEWPSDIPRPPVSADSPAACEAMETDPFRLNDKGRIAEPDAFLSAVKRRAGLTISRDIYDQVISQYGDGGSRCHRRPRRGSRAGFVFEALMEADDARFAERQAMAREVFTAAGIELK